jgi:PAS domain S-box-containing protein
MQVDAEYGECGPQVSAPAALLNRSEGSRPLHPLVNALMSVMPGHVAVLDRAGTIVAVNEAWSRFFGESHAPGLIHGVPGANYLAACREATRPSSEYARSAAAGAQAVVAGEQPRFELEYLYHSPAGQRWFLLQMSALPGDVGGAIVSHLDISERKRAQEERADLLAREEAARSEAERLRAEVKAAREEAQAARAAAEVARTHAKAAVQKLRGLNVVTDAALRHVALEDLLPAVLDRLRRIMGVDSASILLVTEDEQELKMRFARGALQSEEVHIPVGAGVAGRIAASRQPLVVEDLSTTEVASSTLREQLRSLAGVPLLVQGRLIGVLHVGTTAPRRFGKPDIDFLERVGDRIAPALERARLYEATRTARRQAEAHSAQLQATIDSMTDSVIVFDRGLRIIQTNAAAAEMLGFGPQSGPSPDTLWQRLQKLHIRDSRGGRRLKKSQTPFSRIVRGETVTGASAQDFVLQAAGRHELVVSASGAPVRDAEGRITGGVAVLRDVTKRRQLEREVTERANALSTLVETITDGVLICDDEGRIVHANQAHRHLIAGDTYPDFYEQSLEVRAHLLRLRDDQGLSLLPARIPMNMLLRGEALQGSTAMDVRVRALDGRELVVSVSGAPLRDASGRVTGTVSVFCDVTERRKLERRTRQALQALVTMARIVVGPGPSAGEESPASESADMPQRLAELTLAALGCESAGILALDVDSDALQLLAVASNVPWVEWAWRKSYRREPRLSERFGPLTIARLRADEVVTFGPEHLTQERWDSVRRKGESSKESWQIAPMSASGRLVGLLRLDFGAEPHAFTDEELALAGAVGKLGALALERELLQREWGEARANELAARQVNQEMDEFLAVASHDLRQPATSGSGYVQLATRRFKRLASEVGPQNEEVASQFQAVENNLARAGESLERLSNLVSRLFDVSRIRAGQFEITPAPMDLAAIVQDIVEEQRMAAPTRRIKLDLPAGQAVPVDADALRIGQALTNFLSNALRYSPEDHPVQVSLQLEGQQARVAVRDEGPGIHPAELDRIWAIFQRSPRRGDEGGLGLGLYISHEIIEHHDGQVGVESVVGQGSTFWFTLPLAQE